MLERGSDVKKGDFVYLRVEVVGTQLGPKATVKPLSILTQGVEVSLSVHPNDLYREQQAE